MICPKCGYKYNDNVECKRCGIVFARYHFAQKPLDQVVAVDTDASIEERKPGLFRRFCRVFLWVSLGAMVLALLLILRTSPAPKIEVPAEAIEIANAKVREFQAAADSGRESTLQMSTVELNGWLSTNLALQRERRVEETTEPAPAAEPTVEEVQSNLKDVQIELLEDGLRAYVVFDFHGKDLSLQLEGKLVMQGGYLRLIPTGGKLGSLPLPQATLESAAQRLFDAPENREKFRLPPHIRDIRVEHGELIVSSQ